MTMNQAIWGLVRDARSELVGRQAELLELDRALAAVEDRGEARVVTLIGPAGIGKSRLIQDFVIKHRALGSALVPRVYRGSPRDSEISYGLFARLLRSRFGLVENMNPEAAKKAVRSQVAKVLGEERADDVVYFVGQFVGLEFEGTALTRAIAADPQQATLIPRSVLKAFLEADAAHAPMCLIFEDIHLAHDDSLALLRYLLEYVNGPMLMLCSARPELLLRCDDWSHVREANHKVLELAPLDDESAALMMQALLSPCVGGPPQALIDAACDFAGGNPLLLEQMVRIYHDKGVLEERGELADEVSWLVHLDRLATARLPITVEDAVNSRLAALTAAEREVLEQAATMGSVFWSGAFVALRRADGDAPDLWGQEPDDDVIELAALLGGLVERDYILKLTESTFTGSDEYVFKHNKEREGVQRRTAPAAAKRYHRVIAEWLSQQEAVSSSEEYIAMAAEHREKGGDTVRAGLAYIAAGGVARKRYASVKACEYYEKGLTLLGEAHSGRRIDALHDYGDVLLITGRIDDALASFREMLTLAYRLDLRRKGGAAHNRIGRLYRDTGELDEAAHHLTTALTLFETSGDERGVASTIDDLGKLHWLKGEYEEALVRMQDGLQRRKKLGCQRSIALSLNNLGLVLQDSGKFHQALAAFEQSLTIRREIEDLIGIVVSLNNLGSVAQDQRDLPHAIQLFEESLAVARRIGDRNRVSLVLTNLGEAYYRSAQSDKAIVLLHEAEELCDELGDKLGLAEALRALGKAHLLQGELPKARECISRAVDLFASIRSRVHLGIALRTLGEITAGGGWGAQHTKSAKEYFARSASIFEETGNEVELARTYKTYAKFIRTEPQLAKDAAAQADATRMDEHAERIFVRLKISGVGVATEAFEGPIR